MEVPLEYSRPANETDPDRTAFDVKELHAVLSDFSRDELRQIPLLRVGEALVPEATYLDLADRERGEFLGTAMDVTRAEHWIVPKTGVDYRLWNRLCEVSH